MKVTLKPKCLYCVFRVVEMIDKKIIIHSCLKKKEVIENIIEQCCEDFKGR